MRRLVVAALAATLVLAACSGDDDGAATTAPSTTVASTASVAPTTTVPGGSSSSSSAQPSSSSTEEPAPSTTLEPEALRDPRRDDVPDLPSGYLVGYYGDSIGASVQEWVGIFLRMGGLLEFEPNTFAGSALCDWEDVIDDRSQTAGYWAVILLFSNNAFTPCMAGPDGEPLDGEALFAKFEADLTWAVDRFLDGGARVYLPTLAITRAHTEKGEDYATPVNEILARVASTRENVTVVEADRVVELADGTYTESLPCLPFEPCLVDGEENFVRAPDGAHFCTPGRADEMEIRPDNCPQWAAGAFRYAGAITAPVIEDAYRATQERLGLG